MDRPPLNRRNDILAEEFTANYQAEVRCGRCGLSQCSDCRSQTQENHDETNPNLPTRDEGVPLKLDGALRLPDNRDVRRWPRPCASTDVQALRLVKNEGRTIYCHIEMVLRPGKPLRCSCGDWFEVEA